MSKLIDLEDKDYIKAIEGKKVIVDVWAEWCGPCRMFLPTLAEFAEENPDIEVYKVNADKNPDLVTRLGIRSIPTILFYNDGELVDTIVGPTSKEKLKTTIR